MNFFHQQHEDGRCLHCFNADFAGADDYGFFCIHCFENMTDSELHSATTKIWRYLALHPQPENDMMPKRLPPGCANWEEAEYKHMLRTREQGGLGPEGPAWIVDYERAHGIPLTSWPSYPAPAPAPAPKAGLGTVAWLLLSPFYVTWLAIKWGVPVLLILIGLNSASWVVGGIGCFLLWLAATGGKSK